MNILGTGFTEKLKTSCSLVLILCLIEIKARQTSVHNDGLGLGSHSGPVYMIPLSRDEMRGGMILMY